MHKLLYVSATRRGFPEAELKAILASARSNNARLGVTGLFLYMDGGFLQVLEGEKNTLHDLYSTIERDPRHWDTRVLMDGAYPRNFGEWSMGFESLGPDADPGLVGITKEALEGLIKPGAARPVLDVLLRTFRSVQGGT